MAIDKLVPRNDCDIYISIDMQTAIENGIDFYLTPNGDILTEGDQGTIDPKYFLKVETLDGKIL